MSESRDPEFPESLAPQVAITASPHPSVTARSTLADVLRLMGSTDTVASSDVPIATRRVRTSGTLFHEGSPVESVYFVRSGSFKTFHTVPGGYEQLLGFFWRAEVLGYDGVCMPDRPSEAVALEDSTLYVMPLRDLFAFMGNVPTFARLMQHTISLALTRQVELSDVTAAVASEVRLGRFLMHLSRRQELSGQSPRRLLLRMSRRDIASYLGVAHETVSRSFAALAEWGLVRVDHREVELISLDELKALSLGTRRQPGEAGRGAAREPARAAGPEGNRPLTNGSGSARRTLILR